VIEEKRGDVEILIEQVEIDQGALMFATKEPVCRSSANNCRAFCLCHCNQLGHFVRSDCRKCEGSRGRNCRDMMTRGFCHCPSRIPRYEATIIEVQEIEVAKDIETAEETITDENLDAIVEAIENDVQDLDFMLEDIAKPPICIPKYAACKTCCTCNYRPDGYLNGHSCRCGNDALTAGCQN
jgi:hypothetical protein